MTIAGFGAAEAGRTVSHRLALSVVPSLIGWVAVLLPQSAGLAVLAAAFALMLLVDLQAPRKAEVPAWYPMLRLPLVG